MSSVLEFMPAYGRERVASGPRQVKGEDCAIRDVSITVLGHL